MKIFLAACLLMGALTARAQYSVRAIVKDSSTGEALQGVTATLQPEGKLAVVSDTRGFVLVKGLAAGPQTLVFSHVGYHPFSLMVTLPDTATHTVWLAEDAAAMNAVVVVASTRSNERIENATTKVEVLGPEEMNEESTLKPGNIISLIGDLSGVQIQQSSAVTGNANVRIQGLDGRYTQILRDGMPLYGGYSGGFGLLSIPPLDLKQVELIKGSSSTLYGGGAIGGLLNLVSKKPGYEPDASFLVNQTTLKETNINAYYGQRWKKAGFTFFAGQNLQQEVDVNKDGLSDVPNTKSTMLHPVLFLYPSEHSTVSLGWSGSFERRLGGDMLAIAGKADAGHPYFEKNQLDRHIFTLLNDNRLGGGYTLTVKGSVSLFSRKESTNTYVFNAKQQNYYGEVSLLKHAGRHTLISGVNTTGDDFTPDAATPAPVGSFSNSTIGAFLQDTWQATGSTKLEAGLRVDHHTQYGSFVLPRIALFQHMGKAWGARLGFGMGYITPNPLTPQIRDFSIYDIQPIATGMGAEKSYGGNAEINYKKEWGEENRFFVNAAFFLTQIDHPIVGTEDAFGRLSFSNMPRPVVTQGVDVYTQVHMGHWEIYLGYTYTDAVRKYLPGAPFMPVTPRNRAASTALYEMPGKWRAGLEASYTGHQYREDGSPTPDYLFMAAMAEKDFGPKWSVVVNCENLLDERQSKHESLYTGSITNPQFKTLWAPIDGRIVNLSIRFKPFAKGD